MLLPLFLELKVEISLYVKAFPFPGDDATLLLFSTRTGAVAAVFKEVWEELKGGACPGAELIEALTPLGILVDSTKEEMSGVHRYLEEVNGARPGDQVAVILNLRCNFACPYCYENGIKDGGEMTLETADALIEFLKKRWRNGQEELVMQFYGGEPLLSEKLIHYIAGALGPFVEERGGKFWFSLVTNGSLLRSEVVERLKPLGLQAAKVTIDGPREFHDNTRPTLSGDGTFDRIVANLIECAGKIRLAVSGNYSENNYGTFPHLLDHLLEVGLGPEQIEQVQFGPVMHIAEGQTMGEHISGCITVNEPWVTKATIDLHRAILERGYKAPEILPTPCAVDVDSALTIHLDGTVTKCPAMVGDDGLTVGNISAGLGDVKRIFGEELWSSHSRCAGCEYLPLCFGGCRFMSLQRTGQVDVVDCKRDHYAAVLPDMIADLARIGFQ